MFTRTKLRNAINLPTDLDKYLKNYLVELVIQVFLALKKDQRIVIKTMYPYEFVRYNSESLYNIYSICRKVLVDNQRQDIIKDKPKK